MGRGPGSSESLGAELDLHPLHETGETPSDAVLSPPGLIQGCLFSLLICLAESTGLSKAWCDSEEL